MASSSHHLRRNVKKKKSEGRIEELRVVSAGVREIGRILGLRGGLPTGRPPRSVAVAQTESRTLDWFHDRVWIAPSVKVTVQVIAP